MGCVGRCFSTRLSANTAPTGRVAPLSCSPLRRGCYPTCAPSHRPIVCADKSFCHALFFLVQGRRRQLTPAANLPRVQVEKVPGTLEQPPEPPLLPSLHQSHRASLSCSRWNPFLGELGLGHLPIPILVLWSDPHTLLILQDYTEAASHLATGRRR
jgi:hypothetical protein